MRIVRLALLTVVALLLLGGIAVGSRIEVGAGSPFLFLSGTDQFGKVSVVMEVSGHRSVALQKLRYANECSRRGTLVPGTVRIDRHGHLHRDSGGFLVTGYVTAHGTTDIVKGAVTQRGDCDGDSDAVQFTARAS
jgi:hypothetical protein